jgi:hypothetical protein
MGDNIWDWFLPIRPTQGGGARFPYNEALVEKLQARARAIVSGQSVGEAVQPPSREEERDHESRTYVAPSSTPL